MQFVISKCQGVTVQIRNYHFWSFDKFWCLGRFFVLFYIVFFFKKLIVSKNFFLYLQIALFFSPKLSNASLKNNDIDFDCYSLEFQPWTLPWVLSHLESNSDQYGADICFLFYPPTNCNWNPKSGKGVRVQKNHVSDFAWFWYPTKVYEGIEIWNKKWRWIVKTLLLLIAGLIYSIKLLSFSGKSLQITSVAKLKLNSREEFSN